MNRDDLSIASSFDFNSNSAYPPKTSLASVKGPSVTVSFSSLQPDAHTRNSVSVTGLAEPEEVDSRVVTDGVLLILGVQPVLGRWFTRQDDSPGSPETVMLAYGYWQRKFGGDPAIIGQRLLLDGRAREVIGVMPRSFHFMNLNLAVILPFQLNRNKVFIGNFSFQALARLKPGVSIPEANADVARMLPMMSRKYPPAPGMISSRWARSVLTCGP